MTERVQADRRTRRRRQAVFANTPGRNRASYANIYGIWMEAPGRMREYIRIFGAEFSITPGTSEQIYPEFVNISVPQTETYPDTHLKSYGQKLENTRTSRNSRAKKQVLE